MAERFDIMKYWPVFVLALSLAGTAVTGWFQIQANAADLENHVDDAADDQSRIWTQVQTLLSKIEENEDEINELQRGDDHMGAKLELEVTKLRSEIEGQSQQLDTILQILRSGP